MRAFLIFIGAAAVIFTIGGGSAARAQAAPVGYLDGIDGAGRVWGWAADPNAPSQPVEVHLYLDGPAAVWGGGQLAAVVKTDLSRADVTAVRGFPGNHGFEWFIPSRYRLGSHRLYAYAVTRGSVSPPLLTGSPKKFGIQTYRRDSTLYLESGTARVGVSLAWGGAITEVSDRGLNTVNSFDAGREIQVAFYDGGQRYDTFAGASGAFGWNPVQGGDKYNHGSPVLNYALGPDSIYTKSQPLEWNPDDKGGGRYRPVPSDIIVEQKISFLPHDSQVVVVNYTITHLGADRHREHFQEFPAVYLNKEFGTFVYYGGAEPWTGAAVSVTALPRLSESSPEFALREHWSALVNGQNNGLTVFAPPNAAAVGLQIPEGAGGARGNATNMFRHISVFGIEPQSVFSGRLCLIPGDYRRARRKLYWRDCARSSP